jgi:hypothetical protein
VSAWPAVLFGLVAVLCLVGAGALVSRPSVGRVLGAIVLVALAVVLAWAAALDWGFRHYVF